MTKKNICNRCGDLIPPLSMTTVICTKCLCKPVNIGTKLS